MKELSPVAQRQSSVLLTRRSVVRFHPGEMYLELDMSQWISVKDRLPDAPEGE